MEDPIFGDTLVMESFLEPPAEATILVVQIHWHARSLVPNATASMSRLADLQAYCFNKTYRYRPGRLKRAWDRERTDPEALFSRWRRPCNSARVEAVKQLQGE